MNITAENGTAPEFIAYEYLTIRVDRDLESLYADTYHNFGWEMEGYATGMPNTTTVALKLRRDRRIKNRAMVVQLQRKAEAALGRISGLERSKNSYAMAWALGIGIAGSAFLAGSVFALNAGNIVLTIVLGAIGLLGWLVGFLAHGRVKESRTAAVTPLIDAQYQTLYEIGEEATRLQH